MESFLVSTDASILVCIFFVLMVVSIYLGRYLGKKRNLENHKDNPGNTMAATALYGLLGLILAFTFGMSGARYEARRDIMVEEANCIGTALLRVDLYPDSVQQLFKKDFREYIEARIEFFEARRDLETVRAAWRRSDSAGARIWLRAAQLSKELPGAVPSMQMIPALNTMFDIANSRLHGELNRIPESILVMLLVLALASAFITGYSSAEKAKFDWLIAFAFCLLITVVVYFILDLDRPRRGIVNLDHAHRAMTDLRKMLD